MPRDHGRALLGSLYPLALLLVVVPLLDPLARALPARWSDVGWRFGATGMLLDVLVTPLLGLALGLAVAYLLGHRGAMRLLAAAALLAAVLLLLLVGSFALDYAQVRAAAADRLRPGIDRAAWKEIASAALALPTALALGIGGWAASRGIPPARRKEEDGVKLVVGRER